MILINFFFTFQTNDTFGLYDDGDIYIVRGNPHLCLYFLFTLFIISYIYILWLYTRISFVAKGVFSAFCHCNTGIISVFACFIASLINNVINYHVRWTRGYSTYCCFGAI